MQTCQMYTEFMTLAAISSLNSTMAELGQVPLLLVQPASEQFLPGL